MPAWVANVAGLGDATEPGRRQRRHHGVYVLRHAVGVAALLMFHFVRAALGKPEAVSARGTLEQRAQ
ncbi:MAG TPA: hypothetical protein VGI28_09645 [Stellaceae bacterium]